MKIAIISDSHDNVEEVEKFRKIAENQFDAVIHCGDIGAPLRTWFNWKIPIYFTFGNSDGAVYEIVKRSEGTKFKAFKPFGEIELDNKKIAFIHYPELAYGLAYTKKYDIVFYGHSHKSKVEQIENCLLVNPGGLKGDKEKPAYAVYDTKTNEVEIKEL